MNISKFTSDLANLFDPANNSKTTLRQQASKLADAHSQFTATLRDISGDKVISHNTSILENAFLLAFLANQTGNINKATLILQIAYQLFVASLTFGTSIPAPGMTQEVSSRVIVPGYPTIILFNKPSNSHHDFARYWANAFVKQLNTVQLMIVGITPSNTPITLPSRIL